jgi:glycosyltransferase involved in cell wall biosynthesis
LPVVSNAGIGDLDELIAGERIGVLLREFTPEAYAGAIEELDALSAEEDLRARCQAVARREFDLQRVGGPRYRRLYQRLLQSPDVPAPLPQGMPEPAVK